MNCLNNNCGNGDYSKTLKKFENDSKCKSVCCIGKIGPMKHIGPTGNTVNLWI